MDRIFKPADMISCQNFRTQHRELIKEMLFRQQEQIKAAWSLLSTLHCLLLPDKVKELGKGAIPLPQF
jgi:hypothetical protein